MPNINPNSTNYIHSFEPNTNDIHHALGYNFEGKPVLRTTDIGYGQPYQQRYSRRNYDLD